MFKKYMHLSNNHTATYLQGYTFKEKTLGPPGLQVFRFSRQQKYFSKKHGKLVAGEDNI